MLAPVTQEERLYEGSVRLRLEPPGDTKAVSQFVGDLQRAPQLRLLRLDGRPGCGADILLRLREPLPLKYALHGMKGVRRVDDVTLGAGHQVLQVTLLQAS